MSVQADKPAVLCNICDSNSSLYTCPRCNISYCSLACYRDTKHLNCSELFYKDQVFSALASQPDEENAEVRKRMEDILMRLHATEMGAPEFLDSDDDDDDGDENENEDNADSELSTRLAGVQLDDADAVWQKLTAAERAEFEKLLQTGGITELLPEFSPWWDSQPKLVEEVQIVSEDVAANCGEPSGTTVKTTKVGGSAPTVVKDVPCFNDICRKNVSPCLPFNAVNIIGAYAYTVRCFNGEHLEWPSQSAYTAWRLSGTLSNNHNFASMVDAISSVALNMTQNENASEEEISIMKCDAKSILSSPSYMRAALSDILMLFRAALHQRPSTAKGPFTQRFPDGADNLLPRDKLKLTVKKVEFYLSWVLQDDIFNVHKECQSSLSTLAVK